MFPHQSKHRKKKPVKGYNVLLDEMFPKKTKFRFTNKLHNVRHILHDIKKKAGTKDYQVLKIAQNEKATTQL